MKLLVLVIVLFFIPVTASFAQCPTIRVVGPDHVMNPGEEIKFRVEVGTTGPLEYLWTTSSGKIVEGQGTSAIAVESDKNWDGFHITVTVEVKGLPINCEKVMSETALIQDLGHWDWDIAAYGVLKPIDERSRLDLFFAELSNNPSNSGLIILRILPNGRRDIRNRRLQFILKHAKYRSFDRSRLWFALEPADREVTIPVRIPPGGDMPPCKHCVIIKIDDSKK